MLRAFRVGRAIPGIEGLAVEHSGAVVRADPQLAVAGHPNATYVVTGETVLGGVPIPAVAIVAIQTVGGGYPQRPVGLEVEKEDSTSLELRVLEKRSHAPWLGLLSRDRPTILVLARRETRPDQDQSDEQRDPC